MSKPVEIIVRGQLVGSESENISKVHTEKRWMHRLTVTIEEVRFTATRVVGRKQLMETLAPGTKLMFVCTEARMRAMMGEAPENGTAVEFTGNYAGSKIIALSAATIL